MSAVWESSRRWLLPSISLAIFAAMVLVIHRELAHVQLRQLLAYIGDVPRHALFAAAGCTALSYLLLGGYDRLALRYVRKRVRLSRVLFVSFVAHAIGHSVGAAALSGGAVRYRLYTDARLSGIDVATVQGYCSLTSGLGLLTLIAFSLIAAPHAAAMALHVLPPWPKVVGFAVLGVIATYLVWASCGQQQFELRGWSLRPPGAVLTALQWILSTVELSAAASVLWWLLPAAAQVHFFAFLGAYALAVLAGIISHVPGGIGVFESVMLIALPELPAASLLGALVLYRTLYYVAPLLLAGGAFAGRELGSQRSWFGRLEARFAAYVAPIVPQISGTLVFIGAVVLLLSGATPSIDTRLRMLRAVVPLPLLEVSHLLGSIAGVGLLLLSQALFRRVREAYRLTLWLLALGGVASLLKGLDFEEAILLGIVWLVLWLGRSAFYRRASLVAERFTPAWVVSIVGVLGVVTWVGFFAHRHVEYSHALWWTFTTSASAPRTLRAALATALCAGAFLMWNLLRPGRPEPSIATADELERARPIIRESDATLANAALTGDKRILFAPTGDAFLMFQVAGRSWVVLGDPVGERERHEALLWRLRELADEHGGWSVFYQVSREHLPLYLDLGLAPVKIGEEARVPLQDFDLNGPARADLRQARRRAERDGATFQWIPAEDVATHLPVLRQISDAWLTQKAAHEKSFSVGAFRPDYLCRFPLALVHADGVPVAFANVWTTETRHELSVDLMRFDADAPRSAMDFLFVELMLWGREQGYRWFNLGMAPLAGLERHPLAPSWHRVGNFIFRHGEHFYNFEGLRQYKSKFDPVWEPKYLAAPGRLLVLPRALKDISVLIAGGMRELLTR